MIGVLEDGEDGDCEDGEDGDCEDGEEEQEEVEDLLRITFTLLFREVIILVLASDGGIWNGEGEYSSVWCYWQEEHHSDDDDDDDDDDAINSRMFLLWRNYYFMIRIKIY